MMGHDGMEMGDKGDGRMRVKPWMIWHGMCTLSLADFFAAETVLSFPLASATALSALSLAG